MTTTKDKITYDLQGDLLDDNHATRRYFRLWLDGSYHGPDVYLYNVERLKRLHNKPKELRAFIVQQFCAYTAHDAQCSYSYAQKIIVETLDKNTLEKLNLVLAEDALDLIVDWLEEVTA